MKKVKVVERKNSTTLPFVVEPPEFKVSNFSGDPSKIKIDVRGFEQRLDNFFGFKLSEQLCSYKHKIIGFFGKRKVLKLCKKYIPHYNNNGYSDEEATKIKKLYFSDNLKPSAMLYKDIDDLLSNIFYLYQFSYALYILGKHYRMKSTFPENCCGMASVNLVIALWEAGIVSAVCVVNLSHDHTYISIPFTLEDSKTEGSILLDPTSDQLFYSESKKIRNNVMVKTDRNWLYRTDWRNGANLYPEIVAVGIPTKYEGVSYEKYVKEAWKNPVVVK